MKWHNYIVGIAHAVPEKSPCVRRRVGAVIVKDHAIVSTGYNGPARGEVHATGDTCIRIGKPAGADPWVSCCVHAEANAIAQAARNGSSCVGATMYTTIAPCSMCQRLAVNAGIERILFAGDYGSDPQEILRATHDHHFSSQEPVIEVRWIDAGNRVGVRPSDCPSRPEHS